MEGLTFGWKKSIKQYHFFENGNYSLCSEARTNISDYRPQEFLSPIEITPEMNICNECYSIGKNYFRKKIISQHKKALGFWDTKHVCPFCKNKVIFWNTNNTDTTHNCTICNQLVEFL